MWRIEQTQTYRQIDILVRKVKTEGPKILSIIFYLRTVTIGGPIGKVAISDMEIINNDGNK